VRAGALYVPPDPNTAPGDKKLCSIISDSRPPMLSFFVIDGCRPTQRAADVRWIRSARSLASLNTPSGKGALSPDYADDASTRRIVVQDVLTSFMALLKRT
jgi:hypothetical protein